MTSEPTFHVDPIEALLPAARYVPAGFTGSWHCRAGTLLRIRNLVANRIATPTHDCWTLSPAPADVEETDWTALTIGPSPEGGAVFYRGHVINRFVPSEARGERDLHHMERAAPSDDEYNGTDRYPARVENGSVIRYRADGSITIVDQQPS